ncbi:MAG: hypothetical protein V1914_04330 [archaeon]
MKRVLIVLALLILVSGCVQMADEEAAQPLIEEPLVEEPVVEPLVEEPVVEEPVVPIDNRYELRFEVPVTVLGRTFVLTDLDSSATRAVVTIDGTEIKLIGSREEEIYKDELSLMLVRFENYGLSDPRTYALTEIKEFSLGPDEYLVRRDHSIKLDDANKTAVSVSYTKQDTGGVRTATVNVGGDSETIVQGRTVTFDKFKVTNIKTFTEDTMYALLKIVPR